MKISVMITTRNRCADLGQTCRRVSSMHPAPHEVLVCADGCSDATVELISTQFPDFILLENQVALGSVASRDRLLRAATGEIVVSLDDDSYPLADDFFAKLPDLFLKHPEAAVVSFPEFRDGGVFSDESKTDKSPGHYVSAYANCAAAMVRESYLAQPGFPRFFIHMYEETDYALQCYSAGLAVWFEPSLIVRHHVSTVGREPINRHHQNARNELWSVWMRCPWPWLPLVSLFRVFRQFRYAVSCGPSWVFREPVWWRDALFGVPTCIRGRRPIEWDRYHAWMRLARRPILSSRDLPFPSLQSQTQ
jgi:GT2 family glycosyltransferase